VGGTAAVAEVSTVEAGADSMAVAVVAFTAAGVEVSVAQVVEDPEVLVEEASVIPGALIVGTFGVDPRPVVME
jgi:hypothetical protein